MKKTPRQPWGKSHATIDAALRSKTDDCILWPHAQTNNGYGHYRAFDGSRMTANRAIAIKALGAPPTKLHQAAHSCGNRLCVNPRHIRWATRAENEADKEIHGTRLTGDAAPWHKISDQAVRFIRASAGISNEAFAFAYGVHKNSIQAIRSGRKRKFVLPVAYRL